MELLFCLLCSMGTYGVEMLEKRMMDLVKGMQFLSWYSILGKYLYVCLVIYDPASFYGHHEFDLAITRMFGGFNKDFYEKYHQLIPREKGFEERKPLYELFHYLNHWYVDLIFSICSRAIRCESYFIFRNHFGGGYEEQSLVIMRKLVKLLSC